MYYNGVKQTISTLLSDKRKSCKRSRQKPKPGTWNLKSEFIKSVSGVCSADAEIHVLWCWAKQRRMWKRKSISHLLFFVALFRMSFHWNFVLHEVMEIGWCAAQLGPGFTNYAWTLQIGIHGETFEFNWRSSLNLNVSKFRILWFLATVTFKLSMSQKNLFTEFAIHFRSPPTNHRFSIILNVKSNPTLSTI